MPIFRPLALGVMAAALALAGCQQQGGTTSESVPTETAGAPNAKPGISATGGVLTLPAVKGNPGAAYFTLVNGSDEAAVLAVASIDGAGKVELHQTSGGSMEPVDQLEVAPGASVELAPGGLHAMVFELAPTLAAGGTAEMTLTFADGDKLSVPLKVTGPGGAGAAN